MNLSEFNISISKLDLLLAEISEPHIKLDKETLVAYWKFRELSDKIKYGNRLLSDAVSSEQESIVFFNLTNCILAYQSCYDYALQILFFGFGFSGNFDTKDQYIELLKKCRINNPNNKKGKKTEFQTHLERFCNKDSKFKKFYYEFNRRSKYRYSGTYEINSWANCIKHQGGFIMTELYNKYKSENLLFESKDGTATTSFDTQILYPYKICKAEIIKTLEMQNEHIVEFAQWLYDSIFPERRIPLCNSTQLPKGNILLTINQKSK